MFEEIKRIDKQKEEHSIVESIKLLCVENDTSIPKLEKKLGFGNGAIYNWDKNSPSSEKIIKVAIHFKVSADYLLGLIADKTE